MMRALLCQQAGGPESLAVAQLPIPEPGPGQVRVRVTAAGLNFFDTLLIRGKYQKKADFPFSPCAEFAGIVDKTGPGVAGFASGTRVMGWIGWGAAREFLVLDQAQILALPDTVRDDAAAGLAVTYGTAFHALVTRGRLQPGETVAVLGAAGGAGQAAIEVAKLLGARVIACASSAEKLAQAQLLGADESVNYAGTDLKQALKDLTGGRGVDVVYDPVGGDLAEPALRATGWGGRYLVVGFASGDIPKIPANLLLVKGSSLVGVHWSEHAVRSPGILADELRQLLDFVGEGRLNPQIHGKFALEDAAQAFGVIENRQAQGKVLLIP
jgi:NADPH2:quinone reductase